MLTQAAKKVRSVTESGISSFPIRDGCSILMSGKLTQVLEVPDAQIHNPAQIPDVEKLLR